jgi:3-deoxy-D-manno-octulosonic-acid transferase
LDRYGILRGCYAAADVAVVGGTFVQIGGHNILEPALMARPILVGPHTGEIAAVVEPFADAGALMRVAGADPSRALADACTVLFADRVLARTMGEKAAALCRLGAGAAARHARVIVAGPSSGRWPQEARTWWRPTPRAPQCPATAESHRAD